MTRYCMLSLSKVGLSGIQVMRVVHTGLLGRTLGNTCEGVEGGQRKGLNFPAVTTKASNDTTVDSGLKWLLRVVLRGVT